MHKKTSPFSLLVYSLIVVVILLALPALTAAQSYINAWRTYDKLYVLNKSG